MPLSITSYNNPDSVNVQVDFVESIDSDVTHYELEIVNSDTGNAVQPLADVPAVTPNSPASVVANNIDVTGVNNIAARMRAVDAAGNSSADDDSEAVALDRTAPQPPSV